MPCIPHAETETRTLGEKYRPQFNQDVTEIRMVMGYQYDQFKADQLDKFFAAEYVISQQSDRMGYRLEGPASNYSQQEILSEGIF